MAFGTSLDVFREAGFKDADQQHQGTKSLVGPFLNVQLDHLLTRGDNVNTSDFKIVPAEDLSDHSMVVANFFVR
jgi:endonuclease/exonuclease/phosphatase (EEP) superfamily protein YafD